MLNAGVNRVGLPFETSNDTGIELSMATNHLGHFLLVELLRPVLQKGSRVVVVSSSGHIFAPKKGVPLTRTEASDPSWYQRDPEMANFWGSRWLVWLWTMDHAHGDHGYRGA